MPTNNGNKEKLNHLIEYRMSKAPTEVIINVLCVCTNIHINNKITTTNI